MLTNRKLVRIVLAMEAIGFLMPIVVVWLDELIDLPRLLFGTSASPVRLAECMLESGLIAIPAICIMAATVKLFREVDRMRKSNEVVTCSCCTRIHWRNEWLDIQEFTEEIAQRHAEYGMCPHCQRLIATETLPAGMARRPSPSSPPPVQPGRDWTASTSPRPRP